MDLPTRTKQKKSESLSYAILLYKLRKLGIFRNVTDNDYGIDFEVELVQQNVVSGSYFKAQVKAADPIKLRGKAKIPVVSGIKQSTLHYWCRLSHRSHVIAYAVDLKTETVFLSKPVFWAATQLIDGSGASKSLDFIPARTAPDPLEAAHLQEAAVVVSSLVFAQRPQAHEEIHAIRNGLRHLSRFLKQRDDALGRDRSSELPNLHVFQTLLDVGRVLLVEQSETIKTAGLDPRHAYNLDWWIMRSGIDAEEVCCDQARIAYGVLLPLLIDCLADYRQRVLNGAYYWRHTDPKFLELVNDTTLPSTDDATLDAWGADYEQARTRPTETFIALINRIETTAQLARSARAAKQQARRKKKAQIAPGSNTAS